MTRDEVLIIKQWDSQGDFARGAAVGGEGAGPASTGVATFALHSAFADPRSPIDAPDRESIEVRCVVLY